MHSVAVSAARRLGAFAVIAALLLALLPQQQAEALVSGVSGQMTKIAPPADARAQQLESSTTMFTWDERQDVELTSDVAVDITTAGMYEDPEDLTPGVVPAGTVVRSHMVHADKVGTTAPNIWLTGTLTFDQDIVGIALEADTLYGSDFLGAPGTRYPTSGRPERRLNLETQGDFVLWQIDDRTVVIQVETAAHFDQIRILTADTAPEPLLGDIAIKKYTYVKPIKEQPRCDGKYDKYKDECRDDKDSCEKYGKHDKKSGKYSKYKKDYKKSTKCEKYKSSKHSKGWKLKDWLAYFLIKHHGSHTGGTSGGSTGSGGSTPGTDGDLPLGEDANTAPGPKAKVGQEVVWTYVVTNPGTVPLGFVDVSDDAGTPGDLSDDFHPAPVLDGDYNVGDLNRNGLLDPGEEWRFRAVGAATVMGQYRNVGWATGTPVDANGAEAGPSVDATDVSHYFGELPTGNRCKTDGSPKGLVFRYTGASSKATKTSQLWLLHYLVDGDAKGTSPARIVAYDVFSGRKTFDGDVAVGEDFLAESSSGRLGSETLIKVFSPSGKLLQLVRIHTSCGAPLVLGDQWGSVKLVGYAGEKANAGLVQ